jgi:hypothetical protein
LVRQVQIEDRKRVQSFQVDQIVDHYWTVIRRDHCRRDHCKAGLMSSEVEVENPKMPVDLVLVWMILMARVMPYIEVYLSLVVDLENCLAACFPPVILDLIVEKPVRIRSCWR